MANLIDYDRKFKCQWCDDQTRIHRRTVSMVNRRNGINFTWEIQSCKPCFQKSYRNLTSSPFGTHCDSELLSIKAKRFLGYEEYGPEKDENWYD